MKREYASKFFERLENILDWQEDYETKHDDAGSNYAHLICESGVTADDVNRRSESYKYPDKYQLTDDELTEIIRNGTFEMVPGSIFGPTLAENAYCLDSYCVGEIEVQIDKDQFDFEITDASFDRLMRLAEKREHHCLRRSVYGTAYGPGNVVWYAYINTDAVWYVIHTQEIEADETKDNQL